MPFDSGPGLAVMQVNTQWSRVTSVFEENLWSKTAQKKLTELKNLPENWNSYGSQPIQDNAIETTANLLSDLVKLKMPEPQIFPVSGGGIQLEWENLKSELEIEIMPDKSIEYLLVDESGEMHEGQVSQYNFIEIARLAEWFLKERKSIKDLSNVYVPTF